MNFSAAMAGFPPQVWLGVVSGEWPVLAFVNEEHALHWAADANQQQARYVVGPIEIDQSTPTKRAHTIPESREWMEATP